MKKILLALLSIIVISSCIEPINETFTKLPPGTWRGVLVLDKFDYEVIDEKKPIPFLKREIKASDAIEVRHISGGELPFKMNVRYTDPETFEVDFINGDQVVTVDSIIYNRDRKTAKDTIQMNFVEWGTYIKATYEDHIMQGDYYIPHKNQKITFRADHGKGYRFSTTKKTPLTDISGKWEVEFTGPKGKTKASIGEFKQNENHLLGTFMTETGDYGYLEGSIENDKLHLSSFDGTHAFLFEGKLTDKDNIVGSFRSGKTYLASWVGKRNENIKLTNAFEVSKLTSPNRPMEFSYPDLEGNTVTINDPKFKNKIKLIKVSGTWCPNCKDESNFLIDYLKKNHDYPIEVIELNFERSKDDQKNINHLKNYYSRINTPFTVLYAGRAGKTASIPQIEKIKSYPTLFFVDKKNMIRKVHTGFAGPATSGYEEFSAEFDNIIKQLLEE